MAEQLHKRFSSKEVMEVFEKYKKKVFELESALCYLKLKKRQFFVLLERYRKDPESFSIEYKREKSPRRIADKSEKKILLELKRESDLIADKKNPVRYFNYSYLKEVLQEKHGVVVSLPTIISRAKKMGITKGLRSKRFTIG